MRDPLLDRITTDPNQCGGLPCIRGMRFRVVDVLQYMAGGETEASLLEQFDFLERDDIRAALAFAAQYVQHPIIESRRSGALAYAAE